MRYLRIIRSLRRDRSGTTAIEFAIVSGVFLMVMFAIIEYGLVMFSRVAIESTAVQVGRHASIGNVGAGCGNRACEIQRAVSEKTRGLIRPESVIVTTKVISTPGTSAPPIGDVCVDNPNNPYPATCIGWQENSGNPVAYDPPNEVTEAGVGEGGDLVEIRVTYLWNVLFPMFRSHFGENGVVTITTSTVVKNEPF